MNSVLIEAPAYDFSHCDSKIPSTIDAAPSYVIVLGACISSISYIYVFLQYYYWKTPEFVGHPTSLAIYKYQIEFIFVLQFLYIPFKSETSFFYSSHYFYDSRISCPVDKCCASTFSAVWSFISQFSLLSSELWFAAICRDLQLAYTNPFSSYQENKKFFIICITLFSLSMSFGLIYIAPPYRFGVTDTGFIWIQPQFRDFYNPLAIGMFFGWFVALFMYCLYVIIKYGGTGDVNLAGTVSTRLPIMQKGRRFVYGYCAFWIITILAELIYLSVHHEIGPVENQNYSIIGYCLAFRGPFAIAVVCYSTWSTMTWAKMFPWLESSQKKKGKKMGKSKSGSESEINSHVTDDDRLSSNDVDEGDNTIEKVTETLALAPHLNKALRTEILFFTSEGIRTAALENRARMLRHELDNKYYSPQSHHNVLPEPEKLDNEGGGSSKQSGGGGTDNYLIKQKYLMKNKTAAAAHQHIIAKLFVDGGAVLDDEDEEHLTDLEKAVAAGADANANADGAASVNGMEASSNLRFHTEGGMSASAAATRSSRGRSLNPGASNASASQLLSSHGGSSSHKSIRAFRESYKSECFTFSISSVHARNEKHGTSSSALLSSLMLSAGGGGGGGGGHREDDVEQGAGTAAGSKPVSGRFRGSGQDNSVSFLAGASGPSATPPVRKRGSGVSRASIGGGGGGGGGGGAGAEDGQQHDRASMYSMRDSLTEIQATRYSSIEMQQDKLISGLMDKTIQKHAKRMVSADNGTMSEQDAMDNIRSSIGLGLVSRGSLGDKRGGSFSAAMSTVGATGNPILEAVLERHSFDSRSSSVSESTKGLIEMSSRGTESDFEGGDDGLRGSGASSARLGESFLRERSTDLAAHDGSVMRKQVAGQTRKQQQQQQQQQQQYGESYGRGQQDARKDPRGEDSGTGIAPANSEAQLNDFSSSYRESHLSQYIGPIGKHPDTVEAEIEVKSSYSVLSKVCDALRSCADGVKNAASGMFRNEFYDFEFTDYCPSLFSYVRQLEGIADEDYAKAFELVQNENFSEGRSGAFTFYSSGAEYFVKTHTREELHALRDMLPAYVRFIYENPHSLLIRFLGAHKIKMYEKELYFVIMRNVFPTNVSMHERYDLKGSWVNRHGKSGVFVSGRGDVVIKESPLYLDNDIQQKIELHPDAANALYHQVKVDLSFLESQNLMDYSLLVGVVKSRLELLDNIVPDIFSVEALANIKRENPFLRDLSGGLRPAYVEGASTYHVGVIDVLQKWDYKKRLEHIMKSIRFWNSSKGISAIEPKAYRSRFLNRVMLKLFTGIDPNSVPTHLRLHEESSHFGLGRATREAAASDAESPEGVSNFKSMGGLQTISEANSQSESVASSIMNTQINTRAKKQLAEERDRKGDDLSSSINETRNYVKVFNSKSGLGASPLVVLEDDGDDDAPGVPFNYNGSSGADQVRQSASTKFAAAAAAASSPVTTGMLDILVSNRLSTGGDRSRALPDIYNEKKSSSLSSSSLASSMQQQQQQIASSQTAGSYGSSSVSISSSMSPPSFSFLGQGQGALRGKIVNPNEKSSDTAAARTGAEVVAAAVAAGAGAGALSDSVSSLSDASTSRSAGSGGAGAAGEGAASLPQSSARKAVVPVTASAGNGGGMITEAALDGGERAIVKVRVAGAGAAAGAGQSE